MIKGLKIFDTPENLARYLADELQSSINNSTGNYYLAVSGGSTPLVLFDKLAHPFFRNNITWDKSHFFWCDERCVAPDDPESNFGAADRILFKQIQIPEANIHRIHGEDNPNEEVVRYSNEIEKIVPAGNGSLPQFDRVLLGLGEDGHTASLFPKSNLLFIYSNIAGVAKHPVTGQKRISLTADILSRAKRITFVVTQKAKAKVLSEILNDLPVSKNYPASQIKSAAENIDWFIDKEAAFYL
ncbi:MAG: 6-phosphogluconolactonase [Ignavibacteriaceae bacterium]|nr:6-phosphogluconolactonase [Ignavibacteriaceae bacterium]